MNHTLAGRKPMWSGFLYNFIECFLQNVHFEYIVLGLHVKSVARIYLTTTFVNHLAQLHYPAVSAFNGN